jgi:hypothetical protein
LHDLSIGIICKEKIYFAFQNFSFRVIEVLMDQSIISSKLEAAIPLEKAVIVESLG